MQGYTTAARNNINSDNNPDEMEGIDKNKHWEKAHERAEEHVNRKRKEGEDRLKSEGRQTQKEEALRAGGTALRAAIMGLLASLIKDVIRKLIAWFRAGNRKLGTFIDSIKEAIKSFISNMKEHLINTGDSVVTAIATSIFGPVIGMIKKAWMFLKQGYKSVKQAIRFLKDPANKNMTFSLKMMEIGKIVIVGLTAGGAILLSEVIEKGLMAIPGFAIPIPLLGSLANILGIFLGGLVSGLIGALALNLIDRLISKKLKQINTDQQIDKGNEIIAVQKKLEDVVKDKFDKTRSVTVASIKDRHEKAAKAMRQAIENISNNSNEKNKSDVMDAEIIEDLSENQQSDNDNKIDQIRKLLN